MECPKCGNNTGGLRDFKDVDGSYCPHCRIIFSDYQQSRITELEAEIDRLTPKWETGKVPVDGSYWIEYEPNYENSVEHLYKGLDLHKRWSGPIQAPKGE